MSFEGPKFNKPEAQAEKRISKVESEQMLLEMDGYVEGLKVMLREKQQELKNARQANPEKIKELKAEIDELKIQIQGLSEFSQEGKQEGAEFFEKN